MLSSDPGEAMDDLVRTAEDLERKAQRFQDLHGQMSAMSVTETSRDRNISVTVDGNGVPTDMRLAPGTRGTDPAALSAELMACMRRAQAKLSTQVEELVHNAVGDDASGASIVAQYADRFPEPDPNAPGAGGTPAPPPAPEPARPAPSSPAPTFKDAFPTQDPFAPPPGSRKPNRNQTYTPDEPSEDDLYYQRKSWLQ